MAHRISSDQPRLGRKMHEAVVLYYHMEFGKKRMDAMLLERMLREIKALAFHAARDRLRGQ